MTTEICDSTLLCFSNYLFLNSHLTSSIIQHFTWYDHINLIIHIKAQLFGVYLANILR